MKSELTITPDSITLKMSEDDTTDNDAVYDYDANRQLQRLRAAAGDEAIQKWLKEHTSQKEDEDLDELFMAGSLFLFHYGFHLKLEGAERCITISIC